MQLICENDFECLAKTGCSPLKMLTRLETINSQRSDPLALSQGLNQATITLWTIARPAFLLDVLKLQSNENLMGAPIGCPKDSDQSGQSCAIRRSGVPRLRGTRRKSRD